MNAIYGAKCLELSEKFNHHTLWQRMFLDYLLTKTEWHSDKCLLIWKVKVTKCCHWIFQLRQKTPRTKEIDYSLLPTLRAKLNAHISENRKADKFNNLESVLSRAILPTVTTHQQNTKFQQGGICLQALFNGQNIGQSGALNPQFAEVMMGYPIGWTE